MNIHINNIFLIYFFQESKLILNFSLCLVVNMGNQIYYFCLTRFRSVTFDPTRPDPPFTTPPLLDYLKNRFTAVVEAFNTSSLREIISYSLKFIEEMVFNFISFCC